MSETRKPVLTDLLTTSRRLAEAATSGDWEIVAELKSRHEKLVRTFFDGLDGGPLSAHVLSELTQVRVYTDLVLELAKKRRTNLQDTGKKVSTGRRAAAAYRDNTVTARVQAPVAP